MSRHRAARFTVGRQRLGRMISPIEASYTRSIRAQMLQLEKNLTKIIEQIREATPEALEYAVQPIFDESQNLVPVKTGDLKASGFVESKRSGRRIRVNIGYGKAGKPSYGVYVHEMIDVHHEPPTQAKFLEEAVNRHFSSVEPRIREFLSGGFE